MKLLRRSKPIESPMTLSNAFPDLDEENRSPPNNEILVCVSSIYFGCFASHESVNIHVSNQLRYVLISIESQNENRFCAAENTDESWGLKLFQTYASRSISDAGETSAFICNNKRLHVIHSIFSDWVS